MSYRSFLSLLSVSALSVAVSFGCKAPARNGGPALVGPGRERRERSRHGWERERDRR